MSFRGYKNDFAKMKCRETRVQRRELLPLLTLTFTLPRPATSYPQLVTSMSQPESRSA